MTCPNMATSSASASAQWRSYVVSHPEDVEYVLRGNHRNFIKNKGVRKVLAEVLGQGLVTSEGELWRRQRRLTQPAFQLDQIQKYSVVMVDFTSRMLNGWHPGETRNIHSDMMRLTLEIGAAQTALHGIGWRQGCAGEHGARCADEILVRTLTSDVSLVEVPATPGAYRYRGAIRELDSIILDTVAQQRRAAARAPRTCSIAS